MNFDELVSYFDNIDYPAGRLGPFDAYISNMGRHYEFHNLKLNAGFNEDLMGFGLNHYSFSFQPLEIKSSRFHDSEDVCIDIQRKDFRSADVGKLPDGHTVVAIKTRCFKLVIKVKIDQKMNHNHEHNH